jgi:hypothetical protein
MVFLGDGRSTASKRWGDDVKRVLAEGIVASLAEEAARDIVIEDVALALAIFATCDSGVISAAGDPSRPRFHVTYPPTSL